MLKVINGVARKSAEFEKRRVSFVCIAPQSVQIISGQMMVKRRETPGAMPPEFYGPIMAAWENVRTAYPEATADLKVIGALIAVPEGSFRGHIDWVRDSAPKVIEHQPSNEDGA
jgi:hypothetical protein